MPTQAPRGQPASRLKPPGETGCRLTLAAVWLRLRVCPKRGWGPGPVQPVQTRPSAGRNEDRYVLVKLTVAVRLQLIMTRDQSVTVDPMAGFKWRDEQPMGPHELPAKSSDLTHCKTVTGPFSPLQVQRNQLFLITLRKRTIEVHLLSAAVN